MGKVEYRLVKLNINAKFSTLDVGMFQVASLYFPTSKNWASSPADESEIPNLNMREIAKMKQDPNLALRK